MSHYLIFPNPPKSLDFVAKKLILINQKLERFQMIILHRLFNGFGAGGYFGSHDQFMGHAKNFV
jgi:hypothetical protein